MVSKRIAVLGGDKREVHIARRFFEMGYSVMGYGQPPTSDDSLVANSASAAVKAARWIVCPMPGLGAGDVVYAPAARSSVVLNEGLIASSDARSGGLVVGEASGSVVAVADQLGIRLFEMKKDRALSIRLTTAVAEAVIGLLIENTDKTLPECLTLVLGYGAVAGQALDLLSSWNCPTIIAARNQAARARAEQRGAKAISFDDRVQAMDEADIVINTIPSFAAIPQTAYQQLKATLVIDVASPPGGMDHEAMLSLGIPVIWARGLAGGRAPVSSGNAQVDYILRAIEQGAD